MESGQTFGPYRLLEPLGEGGYGRVWKAVDLRLERQVALKVLKGSDSEHQRLLLQEARTACQLHHPNIATIFEVGEIEGEPFIAMELVIGIGLKSQQGRSMATEALLKIASQAASALHAAHQKGIIHRDIKPDNLMLTATGDLKILDFGVAKRGLAAHEETHQAITQTGLTDMGMTTGTPAYMSPEQARNGDITPASDQFSLGLVLWELAAGRHPFKRAALFETLHAIAHEASPTLARERPDLPPALIDGIHRLLAKEAGDRFPDLGGFRALIENPARTPRVSGTPAPPSGRRFGWIWALGAILVLGGFVAFWRGAGGLGLEADRTERRTLAILPLEQIPAQFETAWMGASFSDAMATGLLGQDHLLVLDRARVLEGFARTGEKPGEAIRSLKTLVKELKADLVVLGTWHTQGDQVRLTLRLVEGASGGILKQTQFNGSLQNVLGLEDQLSQRLPALFGLRQFGREVPLGSRAKHARTREWYAKASDQALAGSPAAFEQARKSFEAALASEPNYAPAHAGLAWALLELAASELHLGKKGVFEELTARAEAEARKALALDPSLSGAHRVLAWSALRKGDFAGARTEGRLALSLDPGDFRTHIALGDAEAYDDAPEARTRARAHFQQVIELGTGDWFGRLRYGVFLQNEGDLREAIQEADQAIALQPSAEYAYLCASISRLWLGVLSEAKARAIEGLTQVPGSRLLRVTLALACHAGGDRTGFQEALLPLQGAWPPEHIVAALLQGLQADLEGRPAAMKAEFRRALERSQQKDWSHLPVGERRAESVNLYHMARAVASKGDRAMAQALLTHADQLHPGKRRVATQDPAFKGH